MQVTMSSELSVAQFLLDTVRGLFMNVKRMKETYYSVATAGDLPSTQTTMAGGEQKSWMQLKQRVQELHQNLTCLHTMYPSHVNFRQLPDGKTRVYFLSNGPGSADNAMLYADINLNDLSSSAVKINFQLVLEPTYMNLGSRPSRGEQLQLERKRFGTMGGVNSYELHEDTGKLMFSCGIDIYQCTEPKIANGKYFPTELDIDVPDSKLNPHMCPSNPDLIAFVCKCDIYVTNSKTSQTERLTFAHKGVSPGNLEQDPISAGYPAYVTQEEFNRYQGYWWQPHSPDGVYRILYEEIDESKVHILCLQSSATNAEREEFRFPRAGCNNSKSILKMVQFCLDAQGRITDVKDLFMATPLSVLFPWMEYLVRVGWTPAADYVWVQLLDRPQQRLDLVIIPVEYFVGNTEPDLHSLYFNDQQTRTVNSFPCLKNKLVYSLCSHRQASFWINVDNLLQFLPQKNPNEIRLIWADEDSGFRHLYLLTCNLSSVNRGATNGMDDSIAVNGVAYPLTSKEKLTSGEWEVLGSTLWVDVKRELVYFMGLRENPLEKHLYVVAIDRPHQVHLLTHRGFTNYIEMDKDCTLVLSVYSNIQRVPACQIFRISHPNSSPESAVSAIQLQPLGHIIEHTSPEGEFYCPDLVNHRIASGEILYAMVFKPHNFVEGQKYPTVLYVYGGPDVQVVANRYGGTRHLRFHMLASEGYCVVAIDSRGSKHRGVKFEGYIRCKMGTVELEDQIEMLNWLAEELGFIDMNRLAVHGWSYGGYLSLMALAHYPDKFKVSIAGAPVTSWELYDTGYTERYMDLPDHNKAGYKAGSVMSHIRNFPDEEDRLLIIHGLRDENVHFSHTSQLVDALTKAQKPYKLLVYPNERHSIRQLDAMKHFEISLLSFLQKQL